MVIGTSLHAQASCDGCAIVFVAPHRRLDACVCEAKQCGVCVFVCFAARTQFFFVRARVLHRRHDISCGTRVLRVRVCACAVPLSVLLWFAACSTARNPAVTRLAGAGFSLCRVGLKVEVSALVTTRGVAEGWYCPLGQRARSADRPPCRRCGRQCARKAVPALAAVVVVQELCALSVSVSPLNAPVRSDRCVRKCKESLDAFGLHQASDNSRARLTGSVALTTTRGGQEAKDKREQVALSLASYTANQACSQPTDSSRGTPPARRRPRRPEAIGVQTLSRVPSL